MTAENEEKMMELYRRSREIGNDANNMFLAYTFGLMLHHVDERDLAILTAYMDRLEAANK